MFTFGLYEVIVIIAGLCAVGLWVFNKSRLSPRSAHGKGGQSLRDTSVRSAFLKEACLLVLALVGALFLSFLTAFALSPYELTTYLASTGTSPLSLIGSVGREYYLTLVYFALLATALFSLTKTPLKNLNVLAPSLALFSVVARLGCMTAGCCEGLYGVPIRELEFTFGVIAFIYLQIFEPRRNGSTALLQYLTVYSAFRFATSFFREDATGTVIAMQILSVAVIAFALLNYLSRRAPKARTQSSLRLTSLLLIVVLSASLLVACAAPKDSSTLSEAPQAPPPDVSQTNVQEDGVDEADIVKVTALGDVFKAQSDGVTLSYLDPATGKLTLRKKAKTPSFTPKEMFVYNDFLVVIGLKCSPVFSDYGYYEPSIYNRNDGRYYYQHSYRDLWQTEVKIYSYKATDPQNASNLVLFRADSFPGIYQSSRLFLTGDMEGQMLVVTNTYGASLDRTYKDNFKGNRPFDVDDHASYNGFVVARLPLKTTSAPPATPTPTPVQTPSDPYKTAMYSGNVTDLYVSKYAMYFIYFKEEELAYERRNYDRGCLGCNSLQPGFYRHYYYDNYAKKVDLNTLTQKAEVKLAGQCNNRYWLYENETNFFAVTYGADNDTNGSRTNGRWATFLSSYTKDLEKVATSYPMAPGEQLKSVRFDATACYIVTFLNVDPLFKVDITDPATLAVLGNLKIDGFSNFMQPFGDGLLLGLGYASQSGRDLKLTAFEVVGDYPTEVSSIIIDDAWTEAQYEPKAILCAPEKNIFAIAIQSIDPDSDTYALRQGAHVFGMKDGVLTELSFLTNFNGPIPWRDIAYNVELARLKITRIHFIGNYLITISDGAITSYLLSDVVGGNHNPTAIDMLDTRVTAETITVTFDLSSPDLGLALNEDIATFTLTVPFETTINHLANTLPASSDFLTWRSLLAERIDELGLEVKYWYRANPNVSYNMNNPVRESFTLRPKLVPKEIETED